MNGNGKEKGKRERKKWKIKKNKKKWLICVWQKSQVIYVSSYGWFQVAVMGVE